MAENSTKKNASEQYQKLSQLEHILKRPDTYIGSTEPLESNLWVFDQDTESMVEKPVKIVPGLFKIFDEILVNAADNKIRDPSMKKIEVEIKPEENAISVKNDGKGIPIEMHDKEGMYIPELIFGNLLTSSNYDDDEKKVTGGRNGYGAKLCNIFSTEFIVETADKERELIYTQVWRDNMSITGKPQIKKMGARKVEYTKITFKPDLTKFHMESLDADILSVLRRRVYDLAGTVKGVSVSLNGTTLKIKDFKNYVEMYVKALNAKRVDDGEAIDLEKKPTIIYKKIDDPKSKGRWEIAFAVSDNSFNQISFVNSIATTSGGPHVTYIADQIVEKVGALIKKKHKNTNVKPFQIRNNLFLFVNCLIENPAFTSQTKEQMSTRKPQFGSDCKVPDEFINQILKTEFIEKILDLAQINADKALKKTDGSKKSRITNQSKLEDANKAGTKEGYKCTLILTEGDSALSLAIAGLAVVGRDYYGCFPLRGKMLNVRDASPDQLAKNAEIQAIKQIMGLQHKKQYDDNKSLRYGRIMIMTDQDTDGSHIKGLIINFLESSFPGLLSVPGFLLEFITPIVKVTIKKPRKETIAFYNMPEYEDWIEKESHKYTWTHKYYKGLGTSSQTEGREYFSDLERHLKTFNSLESDDKDLIDLAFSKKKADDRKDWLRGYTPGTFLDPDINEIPISDFINKELILFSMADNIRSIPSVLDGMKPGQRKIIYGSIKRNLKTEIKVAQLAGYISEHTGYHHGEQSLVQTIVGLAQDFVGSNNINLLLPNGSFGTRNMGGKDASAARYIYTELNSITRKLLNPADDPLYDYEQDDGENVEPTWYLPIIPLVLVNGAEGIGTGWSTNVPQYDPRDLVKQIRLLMNGHELEEITPWYKGWEGQMQKISSDKYRHFGTIEQLDETTIAITELPVKVWTSSIKEFLLEGLGGTDKQKPWIKDLQEQHGLGIRFVVTLTPEEMAKSKKIGLYERFKMVSSISLSNMVLFDPQGRIKKYENVNEIIQDFFFVRLDYYQRRKDNLAKELSNVLERLSSQARFIKLIIDRKLNINNRKRVDLIEELIALKFPKFDKKGNPIYEEKLDIAEIKQEEDESEDELAVEADRSTVHIKESVFSSYDYLLGMPIWSLTNERYEKLLQQKTNKEDELTALLKLTAKDLWNNDLDDFLVAFDKFLKEDEIRRTTLVGPKKGRGKKRAAGGDDDDWGAGAKKKTKKREKEVDMRKGELIEIPEYVPPKVRVKKESTPGVKKEPGVKIEPSVKVENSSSSTASIGSSEDSTTTAKTEGLKQSTLPFKKAEPEFKTVFGKNGTIFGALSSTPSKPASESPFAIETPGPIEINSDEVKVEDVKPIKRAAPGKTTKKAAKKIVLDSDEEDNSDAVSLSENDSPLKKPAAKKSVPKKETKPKAPTKKTKKAVSDDDLDLDIDMSSPPSARARSARSARATRAKPKMSYAEDEDLSGFIDDDSEDQDEESEDFYDDDDD